MKKNLILWGWIPYSADLDYMYQTHTYGGEWQAWCIGVERTNKWRLEWIAKAMVKEQWFEHYVIASDRPTHKPDAVLAGKEDT